MTMIGTIAGKRPSPQGWARPPLVVPLITPGPCRESLPPGERGGLRGTFSQLRGGAQDLGLSCESIR